MIGKKQVALSSTDITMTNSECAPCVLRLSAGANKIGYTVDHSIVLSALYSNNHLLSKYFFPAIVF
jgi:hypothetical protein